MILLLLQYDVISLRRLLGHVHVGTEAQLASPIVFERIRVT